MQELYRTKKDIMAWLKGQEILNYTLIKNKEYGWVVDVHSSVLIRRQKIEQLMVKFNFINGFFSCHTNKLKTLKGAPEVVGGYFNCAENQLTSLEFSPKRADSLTASYNKLVDLKGLSKEINHIDVSHNKLINLVGMNPNCISMLEVSNNKLQNLMGVPKKIKGSLFCISNPLKSLEGCPEFIGGDMAYTSVGIKNYAYMPEQVGGNVTLFNDDFQIKGKYKWDEFVSINKALYEKQKLQEKIKTPVIKKNKNIALLGRHNKI